MRSEEVSHFHQSAAKARDAGYDGVEMGLPLEPSVKCHILETLGETI